VFSGLALQQDLYPTTLPFLLILGMAGCAIAGLVLSWPKGGEGAAPPRAGRADPWGGAQGHGGRVLPLRPGALHRLAVAASLLAMGPKVVSEMLGMTDLGLFGYLVAAYLVFSALPALGLSP
jgi:hypothetical protein